MGIRHVAPTNELGRHVGASDFLRLNSAGDERLKPEASGMLHINLHCLRRGDFDMRLVVWPDKYRFCVRNLELHRPHGLDASSLQFAKPLMRHQIVLQDRSGIDATAMSAPMRRANARPLDMLQ